MTLHSPAMTARGLLTFNSASRKGDQTDWVVPGMGMSVCRRCLNDYVGLNTSTIPDISDNGYQLLGAAMAIPTILQLYVGGSQIFGDYGDASEVRFGENWYFMKERGLRVNAEFMHVNKSPVGYTAYPYPVGGNGNVIHLNLEMNF